MGRKLSNGYARRGILMVEVVKQVPAPPRRGLPEAVTQAPCGCWMVMHVQPAPKPVVTATSESKARLGATEILRFCNLFR